MIRGKIISNGVIMQMHEISTVAFLAERGHVIELLVPSQMKNIRTADIKMNNMEWEIKSPTGNSANTVKRAFKTALRQSTNIIFDLRRSKTPDKVTINKLKKEFHDIKSAQNLLIITRSSQLLVYTK